MPQVAAAPTPPSSRPSLISTDIDFDRPGLQSGHLRLPYSHDRSGYGHIPVPIAVLNQGPGPTLLLTGGNHGDEFEGPIALMKLMRRLPQLQIQGRLIVIPGLNFPALMQGTRTSPIDQGNLNRAFPGQRNGSLTEMLAHYVDSVLFPLADVAFDLHAGGASTHYLPTVLAAWPSDPAQADTYSRLVQHLGAPRTLVMDLLGEDRTFGAAADRHGLLFLCGEFGGQAVCNPQGLALAETCIERLMQGMGLLPPTLDALPPEATHLYRVEGDAHYVFAPVPGLFEPAFQLGDEVQAGQIAGWIHAPTQPGAPATEIRFKGAGLALCIRALARVEAGDCLGHLASRVPAGQV